MGIASLATTTGQPGLVKETTDHLSFAGSQRSAARHLRVEAVAGGAGPHVFVEIIVRTAGVDGRVPVILSVTRDSDGTSVDGGQPPEGPGDGSAIVGTFDPFESCGAGQTCSDTFTLTFQRIPEDTRDPLDFDWIARTHSEYPSQASTAPSGASLTTTIGP